jgi:AcrR family transcriptional regulator
MDKEEKALITQQKILQSATEIFSEKGFAGARVRKLLQGRK